MDGTMSTLVDGFETNIGLIYKLLREQPARERPFLHYEPGVQWGDFGARIDVMTGTGINASIRRSYGVLATRFRPGDRIFLLGYSRGAFAVRSLAGMIDRLGLLRAEEATERNIRVLWRHYRNDPHGPVARAFVARTCLRGVEIEMIGVFDTVKALGYRLPLVWRWSEPKHSFHSMHLGNSVRHGYHALALNETRLVYEPILWGTDGRRDEVEQVWFRGTHGDIGGQLLGQIAARGLSNLPLVWMLEKAEARGLTLPEGWRGRFPGDPTAPSVGSMRGWGKLFLLRGARVVGMDPSEHLHPTATDLPPPDLALPAVAVRPPVRTNDPA